MNKLAHALAALAFVAAPACKKKDADAPAPAPATAPGSGSAVATAPKTTETPKPVEAPKPKTGKDLADMYVQCAGMINDGKLDDFATTCVDASYVGHGPMGPDMKVADLKQHFADMRAAFPDMKLSPQVIAVNGRSIYAVALMTGTNEGPMKMPGMPDIPATHKKIGAFMAHKLVFNDANKATEEWAWMDPGTIMFQLGLASKDAPPHRAAADKGLDGAPIFAIAADDAKEKANLESVKKMNDAFSAHKIPDLLATCTDDVVESDMVADKDHTGKKEVEKNLKEFYASFSDVKATADLAAAGDFVWSIGTINGTMDHDMGKMKKTGKPLALKYTEVFQMKDAKVSHIWRFYSSMDFAMQMGWIPAPGEAPAGAGSAAKPAGGAKK